MSSASADRTAPPRARRHHIAPRGAWPAVALIGILALAATGSPGCRGEEARRRPAVDPPPATEPEPPEGAEPARAPSASHPPEATETDVRPDSDVDARIGAALAALRDRQACNALTGCAAVEELASLGAPAVTQVLAAARRARPFEAWVPFAIEALGRSGRAGEPALPWLRELAQSEMFMLRVPSIAAIGRIGDRESAAWLEPLLEGEDADLGTRIAAGYALVRLGRPAARERAAALFTPEAVEEVNWGLTAQVVPLLAELNHPAARAGVLRAAHHKDYFLRRAAVRALARLGARGDAPLLLGLLDDPTPGVRNAAADTLLTLLGPPRRSPDGWKRWAEAEGLAPAPIPSDVVPPGVLARP